MRALMKSLVAILLLSSSVACAQSHTCGDEVVKDTVLSLVKDILNNRSVAWRGGDFNASIKRFLSQPFELRQIHMTARDDSIGSKSCAATIYGRNFLWRTSVSDAKFNALPFVPLDHLSPVRYQIYPSEEGSIVKVLLPPQKKGVFP